MTLPSDETPAPRPAPAAASPSPVFTVTEKAMRPASDKRECFYCNVPIGGVHKTDCVLRHKKVLVRMTVEYEIEVPAFWEKKDVEFHRNEGSWCSNNALPELEKLADEKNCLCHCMNYECIRETSGEYLAER